MPLRRSRSAHPGPSSAAAPRSARPRYPATHGTPTVRRPAPAGPAPAHTRPERPGRRSTWRSTSSSEEMATPSGSLSISRRSSSGGRPMKRSRMVKAPIRPRSLRWGWSTAWRSAATISSRSSRAATAPMAASIRASAWSRLPTMTGTTSEPNAAICCACRRNSISELAANIPRRSASICLRSRNLVMIFS